MKYRINLYPSELRPKVELLTVTFVFIVCSVAAVLLFVVSSNYQQSYDEIQVQTRDTQNLYSEKTTKLNTLTSQRDNRKQDTLLVSQVEKLQTEVRAKQLLLEELKGREQLKNHGFSSLMLELAQNHKPNLWLTRINISENKVRMEGRASESQIVPAWMRQLRHSDYFAGRNFAAARMFLNDEGSLNFIISSDLAELVLEEEQQEANQ